MSQTDDFSKLAYSIGELANKGPIRRSSIYNQIAAGRLRARKIGRRTIVLDEDWRAFLAGAPTLRATAPSNTTAPPRRARGRPLKVPVGAVTDSTDTPTETGVAKTTKGQSRYTADVGAKS
jgi:hypothetical protein